MHVVAFFGLISWAAAAVFIEGPCPEVKPVENFNITAYIGVWYEVARYPNDVEDQGDCDVEEYSQKDGAIVYSGREVINGDIVNYEGRLEYAPGVGNSGILNYITPILKDKEGTDVLPVYIVDIVYDKYAIIYECKYDKIKDIRHDYSWILSRSKTLQGDAKIQVAKYIQRNDFLNPSLFIWGHFTNETCKSTLY